MSYNKQLKIYPEHLELMRSRIVPLDTRERRQRYVDGDFQFADKVKNLAMRYRWDLYWEAFPGAALSKVIYLYANDTHIDSALRHILGMGHGAYLTKTDVLFARAQGTQS